MESPSIGTHRCVCVLNFESDFKIILIGNAFPSQESSSSNMYLINYANMLIWRANNVESVFDGFVL